MGKAYLDRLEASKASNNNGGLTNSDPPFIRINRGTMTIERMSELASRYEVPFDYIYKIIAVNAYISTPSLLEIGMCEESFQAKF